MDKRESGYFTLYGRHHVQLTASKGFSISMLRAYKCTAQRNRRGGAWRGEAEGVGLVYF